MTAQRGTNKTFNTKTKSGDKNSLFRRRYWALQMFNIALTAGLNVSVGVSSKLAYHRALIPKRESCVCLRTLIQRSTFPRSIPTDLLKTTKIQRDCNIILTSLNSFPPFFKEWSKATSVPCYRKQETRQRTSAINPLQNESRTNRRIKKNIHFC